MSGVMSRSNTTQALLDQIRLDIILRRYKDGDPVRELDIASKYSASRAAVRNAMIVLEQEGLIISLKNGTKKIKLLTMDDINDLYDLRSYIENKAIEQIFSRPNRNFSNLLEIVNQLSESQSHPESEILSLDTMFHREMVSISGNRAITQAWDIMDGVTEAIFNLNMTESPEYKKWFRDTVVERHRQLAAVLMISEEQSRALYSSHIQDAREVTISAMTQILGYQD